MTFFNIFSKKKPPQEKPKMKIVVDNREKNSLVASYLIEQNFNLEFSQLEVADYLVGDIAIERKTISDFKSSIINKRIMQQLPELKQHKKYILILEGIGESSIYDGPIHENAFRGFLLSIILNYQVPIIYTQDARDTSKYLALLAKKSPKKDLPLRASKIFLNEKEKLQYILEGFPSIGPVTAKKLLAHFTTLNKLFSASENEIHEVIGKKALELYRLIHSPYQP